MQERFAQRLVRLQGQPYHPKSGVFDVDELAAAIEAEVDGTEGTTDVIVRQIPADDILGPMYQSRNLIDAEDRLRNFLIFRDRRISI